MTQTPHTTYRHDALVTTDRPARWAKQLASHLGRKMGHEETDRGPRLTMHHEAGDATCLLDTSDDARLGLHVESTSAEAAERLAHVVGSHLERFGEKDGLTVRWG